MLLLSPQRHNADVKALWEERKLVCRYSASSSGSLDNARAVSGTAIGSSDESQHWHTA